MGKRPGAVKQLQRRAAASMRQAIDTHENNPHENNPHENNPHENNPHENNPHENNPHENNPLASDAHGYGALAWDENDCGELVRVGNVRGATTSDRQARYAHRATDRGPRPVPRPTAPSLVPLDGHVDGR